MYETLHNACTVVLQFSLSICKACINKHTTTGLAHLDLIYLCQLGSSFFSYT